MRDLGDKSLMLRNNGALTLRPDAQAGSAHAWLRVLAGAFALFGAPSDAQAAAWTLATEQQIQSFAAGRDDYGYGVGETSFYFENAINPESAIVASTWAESTTGYDGPVWRGEASLALKRSVDIEGPQVSAIQAGVVWRSDLEDCSEAGVEVRWLGGTTLAGGALGAFANVEAAVRAHDGGCGGLRYDLTMGFRPQDNWLALAQVFSDAPEAGDGSLKAQLSLVRFDHNWEGVQLGLRAPIDGGEGPVMLVLGLWN